MTIFCEIGVSVVLHASEQSKALKILHEAGSQLDLIFCGLESADNSINQFIASVAESSIDHVVFVDGGRRDNIASSLRTLATEAGIRKVETLSGAQAASQLVSILEDHFDSCRDEDAPLERPMNWSRKDLVAAIAQNEFAPFYQPKVNLRTGEITCAEILARWRHPDISE